MADLRIVARDQNKVFVERADARRLSPSDSRAMYKLGRGKGGAYVEFDVEEHLLKSRYNRTIKNDEWYVDGSVDLTNRNAQGLLNR